jgi:hypothetical protein
MESVASVDPALDRVLTDLDRTLRPRSAPPQLHAALQRLLQQRIYAHQHQGALLLDAPALDAPAMVLASPTPVETGTLSRREALKAGAAGLAALFTLGHITPALADELTWLAQGRPMTGPRLVGILQAERARWNALLAQVEPDRMEIPGVEGEWSVKELVAHLTWYERGIVEGAQQILRMGTFTRRRPDGMGLDEMNVRIAAGARERPASDVLAEADEVFGQLLTLIAACPEEILNDPRRLGLPDDMVPWMGVANTSYAHYREHEPALRAWLDRRDRTPKREGEA